MKQRSKDHGGFLWRDMELVFLTMTIGSCLIWIKKINGDFLYFGSRQNLKKMNLKCGKIWKRRCAKSLKQQVWKIFLLMQKKIRFMEILCMRWGRLGWDVIRRLLFSTDTINLMRFQTYS